MTKIYQLGTVPKQALGVETYLAPLPPSQGKIIGLDCHPDTFTAAICGLFRPALDTSAATMPINPHLSTNT